MTLAKQVPDLRSLDLLVDVVRLGSVSRAAAAAGISQPSASNRLRVLERQLGVLLVHRSTTGATPTPEGTVIAEWAAETVACAARLLVGVEALRGPAGGRLRVAASFTVAEYLVPKWLAAVRRDHPDASFQLEVMNSTRAVTSLRAGDVDLAFIESAERSQGLATRTVATDELVVIVRFDHPWARRRHITVSELANTRLVIREQGSGTRQVLERALARVGEHLLPPLLELGSTAAVKRAVLDGTGPTVVSRLTLSSDGVGEGLAIVETARLDLTRQLRAVWLRSAPPGRLGESLIARAAGMSANPEPRSEAPGR